MTNMEEDWEIKEAIIEIKDLEHKNKDLLHLFVSEMEEMVF